MLGCAATLRKFDLRSLWSRELTVQGYMTYGRERYEGSGIHTFEVVQALLQENALAAERMITSRSPIERDQEALNAVHQRRRSGGIKVILTP
jgi:threonine dehydrogenase-like Zn-dependent dehydrogenase